MKNTMEACQVDTGVEYQCGKPGQKIERFGARCAESHSTIILVKMTDCVTKRG